jgi:putative membrane protein
MMQKVKLYVIGFLMGCADLVPGVSGGTIAFISGIYEELIGTIKKLSVDGLELLFKFRFVELWKMVPWKFLVPLFAGIFSAIVLLSSVLEFALEVYPSYVWSFFFGLVVASVLTILPKVRVWNAEAVGGFVAGTVGAFLLVGAVPVETPATLLAFFLSGAVAICAMILPGISGSFILLILGKYQQVLGAVNDRNFLVLFVVAAGCVVGLALFSRVLHYLFEHKHDLTVAVLCGFLVGSLRKVWPWKETVQTYFDSHGVEVPLVQNNVMPSDFGVGFWLAVGLAVLGVVLILGFERWGRKG